MSEKQSAPFKTRPYEEIAKECGLRESAPPPEAKTIRELEEYISGLDSTRWTSGEVDLEKWLPLEVCQKLEALLRKHNEAEMEKKVAGLKAENFRLTEAGKTDEARIQELQAELEEAKKDLDFQTENVEKWNKHAQKILNGNLEPIRLYLLGQKHRHLDPNCLWCRTLKGLLENVKRLRVLPLYIRGHLLPKHLKRRNKNGMLLWRKTSYKTWARV